MAGTPGPQRSQQQVRQETRRVLEAFLQGALSPGNTGPPGHVGRTYHDPQRYIHRSPAEHALSCPVWTNVHEEINHVEEHKHGFRTSIKKFLRWQPSPRTAPDGFPPSKDSLKWSKSGGEPPQKRTFSFKSLLQKEGTPSVDSFELQEGLSEKQKEQVLQNLIALVEEEAGIFSKKIEADPLLKRTISCMSYHSFSCMAEAFTSCTPPGIPWLQQQGGWEKIVTQDEILGREID